MSSVMHPQYHQGEGTDQKPKGEASRLNEATPPAPPEEPTPVPAAGNEAPPTGNGEQAPVNDADGDGIEDTSPPEGVQLQAPGAVSLSDGGLDDEMKFLLGGTTRPQEPVRQGLRLTSNYTNRVDPEVYNILPHLIMAAKDPEAPPQLKMLVQLLSHHVGRSGD